MRNHHLLLLMSFLYVDTALAYVGPGAGLGAIGVVVGVIVTVLLAILGIIWYPLKRLFRGMKKNSAESEVAEPEVAEPEVAKPEVAEPEVAEFGER